MKCLKLLIVIGFIIVESAAALEDTAHQSIKIRILPSTRLSLTESNVNIAFPDLSTNANSLPTSQIYPSISLNWASGASSRRTKKITAEIDATYKSRFVCKSMLAEPTGSKGTSTGWRKLSTDAVDMLTGIGNENCTGANIKYSLSPLKTDVLPNNETVTVILTVTDGEYSDRGNSYPLGYYTWEGF